MLPALIKAPWYVNGKGLTMEKWHIGFDPKEARSRKIPIWMHIPGLPLHFWDKDIIRGIANAFGQILAIDSATANRTRLIHARFCVLINMDQPIPKSVDLYFNGRNWTLELIPEFERIKCSKCKQWGHMDTLCEEGKTETLVVESQEVSNEDQGNKEKKGEQADKLDQPQVPGQQEKEPQEEAQKDKETGETQDSKVESKALEERREESEKEEERPASPHIREEAMTEGVDEDDSDTEIPETLATRRKRRGPDLGGEEKHRGRPSERTKRDKDTAEQVELGLQKTLDGSKAKGKVKR